MTTCSLPRRSASLKSRPATMGTPREEKKPGDIGAKAAARVGFSRRTDAALGREFEPRSEIAGIAPRNHRANRDAVHARQLADPPDGLAVEAHHLVGSLTVRHDGDIHRQHLARVEAGLRSLQGEQRLEQHARAGQQHKGGGDLRDRKDTLAARGIAGDSQAAARQAESLGTIRRWKPRDKGQEHGRDHGQERRHPEHAGIHREIERANRVARGVPGQDGEHRPGTQDSQ